MKPIEVPYEVNRQNQNAATQVARRLTHNLINQAVKPLNLERQEIRDWKAVREFLEDSAFHHHRASFTGHINDGLQNAGFKVWSWPYPYVSSIHCDCIESACNYLGELQKAGIPEAARALSRIVSALQRERDVAARSPLFRYFLRESDEPSHPMCENEAAEVGDPSLGRLLQLGMLVMRRNVPVIPSGPDEKDQARQNIRETVLRELRSNITGYRHPTSGWIETRSSELSADEEKVVTKAVDDIFEPPWW